MIHSRQSSERRGWSSILLGIVLIAYAPPLAAQEALPGNERREPTDLADDARAKKLSMEGLAAFDARRYPEAIEKFEAAYELVRAPGLLYNVAQAYRLNGDCALALARYRAFLATGAGERMRRLAEERVAELEPCSTEAKAPVESEPDPMRSTVELPRLTSATILDTAPKGPFAPASADVSPARSDHKLLYAGLGYGGSLLLVSAGTYFGIRAHQAADRVSAASERGGSWNTELAATERAGKRDQVIALAALSAGLVSLGVTTCFLAFDW